MKNVKLMMIILFLIVVTVTLSAQTNSVKGRVIDSQTGEILAGANVYIKGSHIGAASDENGSYFIKNVPIGNSILVCSMINFKRIEKEINVSPGDNLEINFLMVVDELKFSDVVITATRNEALVTTIPVSTEVINLKKIEDSNAKNVGEVLKSVGATLVKSYGAVGSLETVSLRGSTDAQVLILIDGQRLNNSQQGSVDLSSLPLNAIEKIEVVKGGNSAMYGSDAVGGVINIITKSSNRKNSMEYTINGLYGTYNTQVYNASLGQGIGNFSYFVSYNKTKSDGDYLYKGATGDKIKLKNGDTGSDNIFLKAGYLLEDQSKLSAFYKYRKSDNGSPGSIEYPNASARNKIDNNHISLSYEGLTFENFAFNFNGYIMKQEHHYIDPESWMGIEESIYNSRSLGALAQVFTDLNKLGLLSYGYEFRQDKLESDHLVNGNSVPFIGDRQRNVHSLYFQDDWKYDISHNWMISAVPAVRLDEYPEESIGTQFSPKIGISISHDDEWRGSIRGNIGKVFRAPTYNDLYWPEDTWTKGNPNLKPEKGITFDFGFIIQFAKYGSWSIESTYFSSNLDDLILWAPAEKWMPTNIAKATINGIESKINWKGFGDLISIQTGYTYLNAKDDGDDPLTSGRFLIYRPKNKVDLGVNFNFDIYSINLFYNFVGKRFHDAENKIEMGSYELINANLGIRQKIENIELNFRLEGNNLMDKEYQATQGSPLPGREIRFSIGVSGNLNFL